MRPTATASAASAFEVRRCLAASADDDAYKVLYSDCRGVRRLVGLEMTVTRIR